MFLSNNINLLNTDFKGELAALGAACLWAVATVVYGRLGNFYSPVQLNLIKGVIAIALIVVTLVVSKAQLPLFNLTACGLLLISGVVGIALGDTAYFKALNYLGARRALLMETLAPIFAAILALIFLQEKLTIGAWCGIFLTVIGIAWTIAERVPGSSLEQEQLLRGIGFGVLAAMAQASGIVLSRAALADTTISPLWATLIRLSAGVLMLLLLAVLLRWQISLGLKDLFSGQALGAVLFAAFFGTYLAIWLQQTALKFTVVGIAQTLMTTSPLFVLPIVVAMGEVVTTRAILGVIVAITGVALLLSWQ